MSYYENNNLNLFLINLYFSIISIIIPYFKLSFKVNNLNIIDRPLIKY